MKTDIRSSHAALVWVSAAAIAIATLACEFGGLRIQLTDEPSSSTSGGAPGAADSPECLPGILPGKTSRDEALARLGLPLNTHQDVVREVLSYASAIRGQLNFVVVQNGVVTLVTVIQPEEQPLSLVGRQAEARRTDTYKLHELLPGKPEFTPFQPQGTPTWPTNNGTPYSYGSASCR